MINELLLLLLFICSFNINGMEGKLQEISNGDVGQKSIDGGGFGISVYS